MTFTLMAVLTVMTGAFMYMVTYEGRSVGPQKEDADLSALAAAGVGIAMGARGASASSEAADVVILVDRLDRVSKAVLIARRARGIAVQSILLGARERGLGGCIHASVQRGKLRKALEIPPCYQILLVLSLGKPREKVVLETLAPGGDIKYWRDSEGVHHVPKRRLKDLIIN